MPANYYQLLQVSEKATDVEIQQAYASHLQKWQQRLQQKQPDRLKEHIDKVIAYLEQAYQTLSDPKRRADYDLSLQSPSQSLDQSTIDKTTVKPFNKRTFINILILIIIIAIGIYYIFPQFNIKTTPTDTNQIQPETAKTTADAKITTQSKTTPTNAALQKEQNAQNLESKTATKTITKTNNDIPNETNQIQQPEATEAIAAPTDATLQKEQNAENSESKTITKINNTIPIKTNQTQQQETTIDTTTDEFKTALAEAALQKKQNAQNPELRALAKTIAKTNNKHINTIINNNTQFLGAQASNQNVTFKLAVIDGITYSPDLLSTYLTERLVIDNNGVCNTQQVNLAKGILFTFAYYNSKNKLIGSYYIDQQVCQSPVTNGIIKTPDIDQINSVEIPTDNSESIKPSKNDKN